jgi:alanine racemase
MNSYSTWLEIDLNAIRGNIRQIQRITGRPVMAVVKANGYGHGMLEVGRAAVSAGAAWLAVARLEEAVWLRQAGFELPILVMGFTLPERAREALQHRVTLSVHDPEMGRALAAQAEAAGQKLAVHAKIDSGMGRLGVFPEDGLDFIRGLQASSYLQVEGIFTHMARADEPALETTPWQLDRFSRLIIALEQAGLRPPLVHAANSAASLYFPDAHFDLVRPGISIYGLHPSTLAPLPTGFRAALSWKTRLASVKNFPAGHGISYNYRYTTQLAERIGVLPTGYADGLRRRLDNIVLVSGRRTALVGTVCMDQSMVQLSEIPDARLGDEVVLLGQQGAERITAEEIAQAWGTNNYEVVCGLAARVPRIYTGNIGDQ